MKTTAMGCQKLTSCLDNLAQELPGSIPSRDEVLGLVLALRDGAGPIPELLRREAILLGREVEAGRLPLLPVVLALRIQVEALGLEGTSTDGMLARTLAFITRASSFGGSRPITDAGAYLAARLATLGERAERDGAEPAVAAAAFNLGRLSGASGVDEAGVRDELVGRAVALGLRRTAARVLVDREWARGAKCPRAIRADGVVPEAVLPPRARPVGSGGAS